MENKQTIDFTGTSHQRHAVNGTVAHMVNLRHERGVLKPITAKQQLRIEGVLAHPTASSYVMQFVHKNSEYNHWIGVTSAGLVQWYDPTTGHPFTAGYAPGYTVIDPITHVSTFYPGSPTDNISLITGITKILSLKNYLIFITDTDVIKFLFVPSTGLYQLTDLYAIVVPDVFMSQENFKGINTSLYADIKTNNDNMINEIYTIEEKQAKDGKLIGKSWYRWAFRLYDGSHIMPSTPMLINDNNLYDITTYVTGVGAQDWKNQSAHFYGFTSSSAAGLNYLYTIIYTSDLLFCFNPTQFAALQAIKDIIVGVDIFASNPVRPMSLDTVAFTPKVWDDLVFPGYHNFQSFLPKLKEGDSPDSENWYLIQKLNMEDLTAGDASYSISDLTGIRTSGQASPFVQKKIDLKGFWNNWQSRQTLDADTGSWHRMTGKTGFIYNSRLMLGNITTELLKYYKLPPIDWTAYNKANPGVVGSSVYRWDADHVKSYPCKIITKIGTDDGEIKVIGDTTLETIGVFIRNTLTTYTFWDPAQTKLILPGIVSYPDYRAKTIEIVVNDVGTNWRLVATIQLKPSINSNFSIAVPVDYSDSKEYLNTNNFYYRWREYNVLLDVSGNFTNYPLYTFPAEYGKITDGNRVIASGLTNPFTWDPANSYRIGNGKVLAIGANSENLSAGSFGEHPIVVFTNEGIFGMQQGAYPILFQSVSPLSGEILISGNLLPLRESIIFLGKRGVTAIQGKQTQVLSEILNGTAFNPINVLDIYGQLTTNPDLFNSQAVIEEVTDIRQDYGGYLDETTCLGYDNKRDELIVFTPGKAYSWHFSMIDKVWYKNSHNWDSVINSWPESYTVLSNTIHDLSMEDQIAPVEIMLQSNPIKLKEYEGIDLVEMKGNITPVGTGRYSGIYLFGAEFNDNYFILGGDQVSNQILTYKSKSYSRIKVSEIILVLTSIINYDSFIVPALTITTKPKFNQTKS